MRMNSPNTAPRIARGGKSIYGAPLGILMLECMNMPPYAAALRDACAWPAGLRHLFDDHLVSRRDQAQALQLKRPGLATCRSAAAEE
jgi:hypothetical protein